MLNLKEELIAYYKPYYDKNDKVHDIRHLREVMELALKLREFVISEYLIEVDIKLLMLSVCIHDLFTGVDRKNHHKLAYEYAIHDEDDIYLHQLSESDRSIIANAVKEHRSSSRTSEFSSSIAEILASADRGPVDLETLLERMGRRDPSEEEVLKHLAEKFTRAGYNTYPKLYTSYYGEASILASKLSVEVYLKAKGYDYDTRK